MRQDERDVYYIPPNFIEGGTLLGGMFKTRNVIEAGILAAVTGIPVMGLALSLTARIILLCLTALPLALVALIGVGGGSLSEFVVQFFIFLRNRRTLDKNAEKEKTEPAPNRGRKAKKSNIPRNRNSVRVDVRERKVNKYKTFIPQKKSL